jgi:hypothetical protein
MTNDMKEMAQKQSARVRQLEREIAKLISDFEDETGLCCDIEIRSGDEFFNHMLVKRIKILATLPDKYGKYLYVWH